MATDSVPFTVDMLGGNPEWRSAECDTSKGLTALRALSVSVFKCSYMSRLTLVNCADVVACAMPYFLPLHQVWRNNHVLEAEPLQGSKPMPVISMEEVHHVDHANARLLKLTISGSNRLLVFVDQTEGRLKYVMKHTSDAQEVLEHKLLHDLLGSDPKLTVLRGQVTQTLDIDILPILVATGGVDEEGRVDFTLLVSPPRRANERAAACARDGTSMD
eukprot:scaffold234_cov406-Prasinococcus_capsulatus_cf.AAC.4